MHFLHIFLYNYAFSPVPPTLLLSPRQGMLFARTHPQSRTPLSPLLPVQVVDPPLLGSLLLVLSLNPISPPFPKIRTFTPHFPLNVTHFATFGKNKSLYFTQLSQVITGYTKEKEKILKFSFKKSWKIPLFCTFSDFFCLFGHFLPLFSPKLST